MGLRLLSICGMILVAGCAPQPEPTRLGYQYHDGNHIGGVSQTSPEAEYNAAHGTWLWPPAESDRPD